MARKLPSALRERAAFVGAYLRAHRGEAPPAALMRAAQAAYGSRRRNPSRSSWGKIALLGAVGIVALMFLNQKGAASGG